MGNEPSLDSFAPPAAGMPVSESGAPGSIQSLQIPRHADLLERGGYEGFLAAYEGLWRFATNSRQEISWADAGTDLESGMPEALCAPFGKTTPAFGIDLRPTGQCGGR